MTDTSKPTVWWWRMEMTMRKCQKCGTVRPSHMMWCPCEGGGFKVDTCEKKR